jgi:hypothetical protein
MSKRLLTWELAAVTLTAFLLLCPAPASAQFLGQVSTARTVDEGANDVGGFFGLYDHAVALFGQYRRGFSPTADFGAWAGFIDPEGGNASLALGGNVKFQLLDDQKADPFDLALDSRVALVDYSGSVLFSLGESVVFSHDFRISRGSILAPYGAVNLRLDHASSETDWNVAAVGGVKWELSDLIDGYGELVIDNDLGLVVGLNFKL